MPSFFPSSLIVWYIRSLSWSMCAVMALGLMFCLVQLVSCFWFMLFSVVGLLVVSSVLGFRFA